MKIVRLTDINNPLYPVFKEVYNTSFPIFEQRTENQQMDAFGSESYRLDCYMDEDCFVGFIAYWVFTHYIYVEHFAIHPSLRGQGKGGFILSDVISRTDQRIVLEIDPVVDEVSAARLHFYRSYGFSENPFSHIHPPYREGYSGHNLIVLTTGGQMTKAEYDQFSLDMVGVIMKNPV